MKTLKTLLQNETGFPPCQQELVGFRSGGNPIYHVSDRRRLSELNLPKENVLYLNTPLPEGTLGGGLTKLDVREYVDLGLTRRVYNLVFHKPNDKKIIKTAAN